MMSFSYSGRFDAAQSYESVIGDKAKEPRKVWDNPKPWPYCVRPSVKLTQPSASHCLTSCTR